MSVATALSPARATGGDVREAIVARMGLSDEAARDVDELKAARPDRAEQALAEYPVTFGEGMDTAEFKLASHAVWEAMAPGWDERHAFFEATAQPVTERMLAELAPAPSQTILDIAAGTGVVGFAAASLVKPGGRVIVSDFSEAMVEAAERRAGELGLENVECRVLDAEHLALPDATVDGVLCRWGYMLMADPEKAISETRRVLRRGGRVSCAVFAGADENPWAGLPMRVLQERGHMSSPESGAPGILALADRDRLHRLFTVAGFSEPRIHQVVFTWRFRHPDEYWQFLMDAAGAIATVLNRLEEDERGRAREEIIRRTQSFVGAEGIELPAMSLVVSAA